MTSWSGSIELGPLGAGTERVLSDEEMTKLRRFLAGNNQIPGIYILSEFTGFMAAEIVNGDGLDRSSWDMSKILEEQGSLAASYALSFRRYASLPEWPENVTPPAFVYEFLENWLERDSVKGIKIGGIAVEQYLQDPEFWRED